MTTATTLKDAPATPRAAIHIHRGSIAETGRWAAHYSLVVVFLWFGCLKFTDYEASGIAPLVMNSPLVMWWHAVFGIAGTSHVLGGYEILTGLLLAARPVAPKVAAVGGGMAVLCFVITVSFLFTTPGVIQPGGAAPFALSAMPGQFLVKDIVLLSVSLWILGSSLTEAAKRRG